MRWGRIILAAWITFAMLLLAGVAFGFGQMGDCFPEPEAYRECIKAKNDLGNLVLASLAILYACAMWLIFHKRKSR